MMRCVLLLALALACAPVGVRAQTAPHTLQVSGTAFLMNGRPFAYTGLSFFNAIWNPAFNESADTRRTWLRKFKRYGITVLRVWAEWNSTRTYVDTGPQSTLWGTDGSPDPGRVAILRAILADADQEGMAVELALFAYESVVDGTSLPPEAQNRAVADIARALLPHRNVAFQVWNEHAERAMDHVRAIKAIDPARLVTNASGVAGVLMAPGRGELELMLDYLTPHTSRSRGVAAPHWEIAPHEIATLLARFRKPVVDDEPARNGTAQFGGPAGQVYPYDQILQIAQVWRAGGYVTYHHDMFQTGYGTPAIPPSGIPDPEFSPYHRQVFEFLANRERYQRLPQP